MEYPEQHAGKEILDIVRRQVSLGSRYPGSRAHASLINILIDELRSHADRVWRQDFSVTLRGRKADCANLIGLFKARRLKAEGRRPQVPVDSGPGVLLLGTHFDTRLTADRQSGPEKREVPIPGANDGGSGTAVLIYLLRFLRASSLSRDVMVVFFDAEDVGDIDGYPFSLGARLFVRDPMPFLPEEVLVLDMVGGKNMILDRDAHALTHPPSLRFTETIFKLGRDLDFAPFKKGKANRLKYIVCDHHPFLAMGVPSCILIDLDYPEWHTHQDLPEAMSEASLFMTAEVLKQYLSGSQ